MKTSHFPWERLITCMVANLAILGIGWFYKGWLYTFATLDPHTSSGAAAITALSAFSAVMITGIVAIQIYFISGSTKSLEAMFKFNSTASAVAEVRTLSTRNDTVQEFTDHTPAPKSFDDGIIP